MTKVEEYKLIIEGYQNQRDLDENTIYQLERQLTELHTEITELKEKLEESEERYTTLRMTGPPHGY